MCLHPSSFSSLQALADHPLSRSLYYSYFSYFTYLSYTGLCAYYCAASTQTIAYALEWRKAGAGAGYPLQRWLKVLQALHIALRATVITFGVYIFRWPLGKVCWYFSMAILSISVHNRVLGLAIWFIGICYPIFWYLSLSLPFRPPSRHSPSFCHYVISMVGPLGPWSERRFCPVRNWIHELTACSMVKFTRLHSYISGLFGSRIHYSYNTRILPYVFLFHSHVWSSVSFHSFFLFFTLRIFHRYAPPILPLFFFSASASFN